MTPSGDTQKTTAGSGKTDVASEDAPFVPVPQVKRSGSFLSRLSTGTGAFDILGRRRSYYIFSTVLIVASVLFIVLRGFNFGIDFAGGMRLTFQPAAGANSVEATQVADIVNTATGETTAVSQVVGLQIQVTTGELSQDKVQAAKDALTKAFNPTDGVSDATVSGTWGAEISERAVLAVVVFLVLVAVLIWIRYERRVALGAVGSTLHDLIVTAGIYAAVAFEVTPATIIGLLTIMGFSLYDTVVVYDKVQENARGLTSLTRRTYPEAANLAINQTLMRSINTSLIALLPVAGLLVAGISLGSGTLKDLGLVLLVGMLVGAYSSVFLAVPIAVDLKIREPAIKAHTARVLAKRNHDGLIVDADGDPIRRVGAADGSRAGSAAGATSGGPAASSNPSGLKPAAAPRPGAKPVRQKTSGAARPTAGKATADPKPTTRAARRSSAADGTTNKAGSKSAATQAKPSLTKGAATEAPASRAGTTEGPAAPKVDTAGADVPKITAADRPARSGARPTGKGARPTGKRNR